MSRLLSSSVAIVAALSVTVACAASSWPMDGYSAQRTNFNPSDHVIGVSNVSKLHQAWSRRFSAFVGAIVSGDRIYGIDVRNGHGEVVVLDAKSGKTLRTFTAASLHLDVRNHDDPQALAYANGRLVIGAAREVLEISPASGFQFWKVAGGAGQVATTGRTVYTGKGCQNPCGAVASYAIDLYKGRVLWTHRGNFGQIPVLIDGRLFQTWGEYQGTTHVYDPQSGSLLATMPLNASWTGDATHAYAEVVSGALTGLPHSWVEQIDSTGKPVWKADLGKTSGGQPVLAYNTLYCASFRFSPGVVAVNARTGKVLWGTNVGANLSLTAANHLLYVSQYQTGQVTILNASSGRVVRRFKVAGYRPGATNNLLVANGTLYALHGHGIVAYRP